MKGFRFYLEYDNAACKREGKHTGNCIALLLPGPSLYEIMHPEGAAAIFKEPNSPIAWTGLSYEVLRYRCKRISEKKAKEIHPRLLEYLTAP